MALRVALNRLAGAVAAHGRIGMLTGTGLEPDANSGWLRRSRTVRSIVPVGAGIESLAEKETIHR